MKTAAYLSQLKQLLPSGQAWVAETGSVLSGLLSAGAKMLSAVHHRANDLMDEADPRTAIEMLPEWEIEVGLPGKCSASADTIRERQAMVHAKWISRGGQSRPYFIDLAKALEYDITITEYTPFQAGQSVASDPCCSDDWTFTWKVNAPATTIRPFRAGEGAAGEPIQDWGNGLLECAISQDKPAHTHVIFAYGE